MIKKLLIIAIAMLLGSTAPGQNNELPKLQATQFNVNFEREQKDELRKRYEQLQQDVSQLIRQPLDESQAVNILNYKESCSYMLQDIKDATFRQATIAEQLKALLKLDSITPQEQNTYRVFQLELQKCSNEQTRIQQFVNKLLVLLNNRLKQLPPPSAFKLNCNLEMRLIRTQNLSFYISKPITKQLIDNLNVAITEHSAVAPLPENDTTALAELSQNHAQRYAAALGQKEAMPIALPSQDQLEALALQNEKYPVAIWSSSKYPNRVFQASKRKFNLPGETTPYLRLTPSQVDAVNRFKMQFYLVWDSQHLLGETVFTRELGTVSCKEIGTMFALPALAGINYRLNNLNKVRPHVPRHVITRPEPPVDTAPAPVPAAPAAPAPAAVPAPAPAAPVPAAPIPAAE